MYRKERIRLASGEDSGDFGGEDIVKKEWIVDMQERIV